jgi:uncharacterized protein YwgA
MKPEAQEIALAILSRVQERNSSVNKTKLLKLLYLADIEHFRSSGTTLTGFEWKFHFYGPWSQEFDSLLEILENQALISLDAWSAGGREGSRIRLNDGRDLNKVIRNTDEFFRVQHQIDCWADRALPELLDYVYFETEPMAAANSGDVLNFTNVSREPPKLYKRAKTSKHPEALRRLKLKMQAFRKQLDLRREESLQGFRKPIFDDVYTSALAELDGEVDSKR